MAGCQILMFLLALAGFTMWANPSVDSYARFMNNTFGWNDDSPNNPRFVRSLFEPTTEKTIDEDHTYTSILEEITTEFDIDDELSTSPKSSTTVEEDIDYFTGSTLKGDLNDADDDPSSSTPYVTYEFSVEEASIADFDTVDYNSGDPSVDLAPST